MARPLPPLGELEARILQLIVDHQPCSERTVWDLVRNERDLSRTTVLKTIQRLEAKGAVRRRRRSRPILWEATADKPHLFRGLVHRFVDGILGGSAAPLALYLAGHEGLSASDAAALRRIARKVAAPSTDSPEDGAT